MANLIFPTAEEGGGGKAILLERGAYKTMDLCVMHVQPVEVMALSHLIQVSSRPRSL